MVMVVFFVIPNSKAVVIAVYSGITVLLGHYISSGMIRPTGLGIGWLMYNSIDDRISIKGDI